MSFGKTGPAFLHDLHSLLDDPEIHCIHLQSTNRPQGVRVTADYIAAKNVARFRVRSYNDGVVKSSKKVSKQKSADSSLAYQKHCAARASWAYREIQKMKVARISFEEAAKQEEVAKRWYITNPPREPSTSLSKTRSQAYYLSKVKSEDARLKKLKIEEDRKRQWKITFTMLLNNFEVRSKLASLKAD